MIFRIIFWHVIAALVFKNSIATANFDLKNCSNPVKQVYLDHSVFNCLSGCNTPNSEEHYFLFPAEACFKEGAIISVFDGKKRLVGTMTLGKVAINPIDYFQIDKIVEKKKVFKNFLRISKSMKVDLLAFWETYLKLNFSELIHDENINTNLNNWGSAEIKSLKLSSDYYFISGFSSPSAIPQVTDLDYNGLVELIKLGAFTIDAREANNTDWSLPNAISLSLNKTFLKDQWLDVEFIQNRNILNSTVLPKDKNTSIIVYSNHPKEYSSFNLLRLLLYKGYKKLFWYQGGSLDYFNQAITPDLQSLSIQTRDLAYVVNHLNQSHIIEAAALPKPSNYQRILNSFLAKFYYNTKATMNLKIQNLEDINTFSPHLYLNFIPQSKLDKMKNEEIIVYGQNELDRIPYLVAATLKLNGYNRVSIYSGGLDEWRSAQKWGIKGVYFDK